MPAGPERPSVVIPVFEDGPGLLSLVSALLAGSLRPAEIAAVDSSVSGRVWKDFFPLAAADCERSGVRWIPLRLEPGRFNHGWTRNLGVALTFGPLVALFSQDAVPEPDCLERLVRRIMADDRLAGVYARQMPRADTSPPVRRRIGEHYPAAEPMPGAVGPVRYDNVAGLIRRAAWNEVPFPKVEIAEDLAWAVRAAGKGWRFAYEPSARAVHAHELDGRADFGRSVKLHRYLSREFRQRTVPTLFSAFSGFAGLVSRREHTVGQAAGEVFGQYLGGVVGGLDRLFGRAVAP